MASTQQINLFSSEYRKRAEQRDFAAYRALGAISAAVCFCRQNRSQDALAVLTSALARYEEADQQLHSLKIQPTGEQHAVHASN